MAIVKSEVDEPWLVRLYWPRTNGVTVVPGISSARAVVSRRVVGIASRTSRLATNVAWLLTRSTVGDSAVTVSVLFDRADLKIGVHAGREVALQDDVARGVLS